MNLLAELRRRFASALSALVANAANLSETQLFDMVRPSQEPNFGDYQANFAMPLGKALGRAPRDVAAEILAQTSLADLCEETSLAGPGFINLRLSTELLEHLLLTVSRDPRLGVPLVESPRTYIVDYSAPNVAKPMHVGHIRSTVIGGALVRTLRFLGHRVIGDNHLGDWGTQFGMILYGYKHFRDDAAYQSNPVSELARLYRLVSQLVDYHQQRKELMRAEANVSAAEQALQNQRAAASVGDAQEQKKAAKELRRLESKQVEARNELSAVHAKIAAVENNPLLNSLASQHPEIGAAVLTETARLHAGDPENRRLWSEFLPYCEADINRIYTRLGVSFDEVLGESFYHDRLPTIVEELRSRGLARESEGAIGVFLPGSETPMLIQKQDGAFLYATTDLATIQYRLQRWNPDAILYVVDHRQSLHFEQLFAAARLWGFDEIEFQHVSFGTVLGDDGRPFKTRAGDTVGLEGLLDEAVGRALAIVSAGDDSKPEGPELSAPERQQIANRVGIAALKYADLSQNRTSDYVFSYDKMLAMNGNTATYMQYAYARVRSIFTKGNVDEVALRQSSAPIHLGTAAERNLGLALLRFGEALENTIADYRPNQLTGYLFELAGKYSTFFENCPVLRAETEELRLSRLKLCDLTARTIAQGLALLGIDVVQRM